MIAAILAVLSACSLLQLIIDSKALSRSDLWSVVTMASLVAGGILYDSTFSGGSRLVQAGVLIAVGIATVGQVAATATGYRTRPGQAISGFLPFLLASYMVAVSYLQSPPSSITAFGTGFAPVLLWLFVGIQFALGGLTYPALARVVPVVLCLTGLSLLGTSNPWRSCDQFKCGIFDRLLTGPFGSENYLAELAAAALLFYLFMFRGWTRATGILLTMLMLAATGSRSNQLAAAVGVLLGVLVELRYRRRRSQHRMRMASPRPLAWSMAIGAGVVGLALVYLSAPGSFSNRANIWSSGVEVLGGWWPIGLGSEAWRLGQDSGILPDHYPHSEYLLLLFWGGLIAVLIMTAIIASSIIESSTFHPAFRSGVAMAGLLLTLGLTEAYWNPLAVDGHAFKILLVLAAAHWAMAQPADPLRPHQTWLPPITVERRRGAIPPAGQRLADSGVLRA